MNIPIRMYNSHPSLPPPLTYLPPSPPPSLSPPHPLPTLPLSPPHPPFPPSNKCNCPFQPKQSPSLFISNSTSDADSNPRPDPPLCVLARTNHLSFDMKKNWICLKITKQAVTF